MRQGKNVKKAVMAGMAGGLLASWLMVRFQAAWSQVMKRGGGSAEQESPAEQEDATMKAAGKLAELVGYSLDRDQKKKAGSVVHYVFGTLMGGVYGAAASYVKPSTGTGVLYGSGLFFAADELAVPAAGLSQSPRKYPISTHLYGLSSHLVYGLALEHTRRQVRKLL